MTKVINPVPVTTAILTSIAGVTHPRTAADYNAATVYGYGDTAKDPATFIVYQSLVVNNLGNNPTLISSSPYWQSVGYHEVLYNPATAYTAAANQVVYYGNRVYLSLNAANTGHQPDISPTYWEDIAPVNKVACFDYTTNLPTVAPGGTLTIVLTPGTRANAIGLLGVLADAASINITSSGVNVYSKTISLIGRDGVIDGYTYCFNPFVQIDGAAYFDIPLITNNITTIVLTRSQGNIVLTHLGVGQYTFVGNFQYDDATDDADNYSVIERDTTGNISSLTPERSIPKVSGTLWVPSNNMKQVRALRSALNGKPAIWCGLDDVTNDYFPSLLLMAIHKEFSIGLKYVDTAATKLTLEGI